MTWRPISTAPKDGTAVLLSGTDSLWDKPVRYTVIGRWESIRVNGRRRRVWTDGEYDDHRYETFRQYKPSHWQPLPQPPTE